MDLLENQAICLHPECRCEITRNCGFPGCWHLISTLLFGGNWLKEKSWQHLNTWWLKKSEVSHWLNCWEGNILWYRFTNFYELETFPGQLIKGNFYVKTHLDWAIHKWSHKLQWLIISLRAGQFAEMLFFSPLKIPWQHTNSARRINYRKLQL